MLPNYAIMVALACVGGACGLDDAPINANSTVECNCTPRMHLVINGTSKQSSICNNATFDWLVHTLLTQIAIEKEQVTEKTVFIKNMQQQNFHSEDEVNFLKDENNELVDDNAKLKDQYQRAFDELDTLRAGMGKDLLKPMDCADVQRFGFHYSGLYMVYPRGLEMGLDVFCDLNTDGGGWTLMQRRMDGSENFARDWMQYKYGFGSISKEFWMGNDFISAITQQRHYELRIDMTDYSGVSGHAFYKTFAIESEYKNFKLRIKGYSGNAGDAMGQHNRFLFTTNDRDNDRSKSGQCSQLFGNGGWWYGRCYDSNLNGLYGRDHGNKGVVWFNWKDDYTPQREVEMKIRPVGF